MLIRRDAFSTLSMLRHVVQAVLNMNVSEDILKTSRSTRVLQLMEVDVDEWKELLNDIDVSIRQYLVADLAQRPYLHTSLTKKEITSLSTITKTYTTAKVSSNDDNNCHILNTHNGSIQQGEDDVSNAEALMSVERAKSRLTLKRSFSEEDDNHEYDSDESSNRKSSEHKRAAKNSRISQESISKKELKDRKGIFFLFSPHC